MVLTYHTDEDIQTDVLEELAWDTSVRPNEIGVVVKNGIVTLTGWVDTYVKKMAVQDAAHRVRQVKAVANDIEIRLPSSSERTDTDLAGAVLNALHWDAAISTDKLDVTVSKGWVTLKGEVEHGFQKVDATRAVSRLAGVKGMSNQIIVKPLLVAADLQQKIEKALVRNAEFDAKHINIEVHNGLVVLKGSVRSYAEKRAAEQSVMLAPGVTSIDNRITIVPAI